MSKHGTVYEIPNSRTKMTIAATGVERDEEPMTASVDVDLMEHARAAAVTAMREMVADLHAELTAYRLVAWTAGNVSGRVRVTGGPDLMVIKPSGVSYADLTPESMIVCDLDGQVVAGDLSPSSDTAAHAYVYR